MIEKIKQNIALTVGLAIPVAMVLLIAGMVYLPRIFSTPPVPQFDFVYATGENIIYPAQMAYTTYPANPCAPYFYVIENGMLKKKEPATPADPQFCKGQSGVAVEPSFYRHDTVTNKSTKFTFEEASVLLYITGPKSPDGFEVVHGNDRGEIFPFFGGSYDYASQYLKKGTYVVKLDMQLPSDRYYYFGNENNLGWVTRTQGE